MDILTQEQLLLNAQAQFDALKERILEYSQTQIRIDQAERNVFAELLGDRPDAVESIRGGRWRGG